MVLYTEFIYVVTNAVRMLSYVKAMYYGLANYAIAIAISLQFCTHSMNIYHL